MGRKVTDLGKGIWHYEYVVHNMNSDRSARALSIEFPVATAFTNVGFKGIAHHSGEPYATDDWAVSSTANLLSWSTADFATNPNAHALRFATMFNFWFDADQPPTDSIVHTLGLFKPGDPSAIEFGIVNNLFSDDLEVGRHRLLELPPLEKQGRKGQQGRQGRRPRRGLSSLLSLASLMSFYCSFPPPRHWSCSAFSRAIDRACSP